MIASMIRALAEKDAVRRAALASPAFTDTAGRFIAGETPDQAVARLAKLNSFGLLGVAAPVGDLRPDPGAIAATTHSLLRLIDLLATTADLNEISVLPALLGASDGIAAARRHLTTVVSAAAEAGVRVTLDMGPAEQIDATLQLFREFHRSVPGMGIAVQTNLRRTMDDVAALAPLGARVRVCAGAFRVPSSEGHSSRRDADVAFVRALRTLMESPSYPMVATHDRRLIPIAQELADRTGRSSNDYEFQLYYGVRQIEQRRLVDTGHRSRVYLPFGDDWYHHIARRVAARPFKVARTLWTRR